MGHTAHVPGGIRALERIDHWALDVIGANKTEEQDGRD